MDRSAKGGHIFGTGPVLHGRGAGVLGTIPGGVLPDAFALPSERVIRVSQYAGACLPETQR